ncbi:MAG: transposase [Lachnospiraceae bacterium]|nr:transposase [Lachnospiraceae bacterium]
MRKNPHSCELKDKEILTIEEGAALFGIGQNKLKAMLNEPSCPFRLLNGRKRMIMKDQFKEYLAKVQKI